jgi:predicted DNA-binding transcriptional regulator AlpA
MIQPTDVIDTQELAGLLGVKVASLRTMRAQPDRFPRLASLPQPMRTINGQPIWRRSDIEEWMQ